MIDWDTFVTSLNELPEDRDLVLSLRTLQPGIHKYTYKYVRCRVSTDAAKYPDRLMIRFGRGRPHTDLYSVEVLEELPRLPTKYDG